MKGLRKKENLQETRFDLQPHAQNLRKNSTQIEQISKQNA